MTLLTAHMQEEDEDEDEDEEPIPSPRKLQPRLRIKLKLGVGKRIGSSDDSTARPTPEVEMMPSRTRIRRNVKSGKLSITISDLHAFYGALRKRY